jgi:hypothetical protein
VCQYGRLPSACWSRFLTFVPKIKNMHTGIKKGIIRKSSPMINARSPRECGAEKRRASEVVNIDLIREGYEEYMKVPEVCEVVCQLSKWSRAERGRAPQQTIL